ncbi:hypothetical protein QYF36_015257 [Acer negundo]|nr:hypothetical protein QYF36_015257 [Acer negundo]
MGHHNYPQNHQAIDGLMSLLTKSNHELATIHYQLEKEFQKIYPENANPMKLVSRVKKLQEDLSTLKDQCQELLAAKQDLIDKAQTTLVGNRTLVRRMQASLGVPGESEDPAFDSFKQLNIECHILEIITYNSNFKATNFRLKLVELYARVDTGRCKNFLVQGDRKLKKMLPSLFIFMSTKRSIMIINEWTVQVRSRTGDEKHESDSEDINKLLFSSIVESN